MKVKFFSIIILIFFAMSLVSCSGENELQFIDYDAGFVSTDSDDVIAESISRNKTMYYYKNPETSLALDRNVIFIGQRYTIDIDLSAIMQEGQWETYEFKKVNPSKAYGYSAVIDEAWINESAFDIEKNNIIGKEIGHYGVYLKLVKSNEKKYKYIGDYVVTDENYTGFRTIQTVEDWLTTLNSLTMEYCILGNNITFTNADWQAPNIQATFLINPNNYVIDFGGLTLSHQFIADVTSSYLDNISFTNFHAVIEDSIMNMVSYSYFRNVSFTNISIENPDYNIDILAERIIQSKWKGITLEIESFSEEFRLVLIRPWIFPCTYEDMIILLKHHAEDFEFELPISTHINYSLLKNVMVVNMSKEKKMVLRILDSIPKDQRIDFVYVSEGLKNQVINVYGIDCDILYKDVEKTNWYIQGNH
ncbi:MAG: hypothetical protein K2O22_04980 [Anaeroplasmataceae bacterium]|nr:hypothetical protein [Anaeroplasmataceae bacterium]